MPGDRKPQPGEVSLTLHVAERTRETEALARARPAAIPPALWLEWGAEWLDDPSSVGYRAGEILEGHHDAALGIPRSPWRQSAEVEAAIAVLRAALLDGHPLKAPAGA